MKTVNSYGNWPSVLSADAATADITGYGYLQSNQAAIFWVETRPSEHGRTVLIEYRDEVARELTPSLYSVRTRVHEYGGRAYCVSDTAAYFVNATDQDIYKVGLTDAASVVQITRSGPGTRYGDPIVDAHDEQLFVVRETHLEDREPKNELISVALSSGEESALFSGHDFYSSPALSPRGDRIAFLAWDHPNMPWHGTQLYVAEICDPESTLTTVAGGADVSIFQPTWLNDDRLLFASDESGFWNLQVFDDAGLYSICGEDADYGSPQWQLGAQCFLPLDAQFVLANRRRGDECELTIVDTHSGLSSPYTASFATYGSMTNSAGGRGVTFVAGGTSSPDRIYRGSIGSAEHTVVAQASLVLPDAEHISQAESITFAGEHGDPVHAYFYAPCHRDYIGSSDERSPCVVMTHGGPNSRTNADFRFKIQYYTNRGWSVLDVNYSGSTGYGREYWQRLDGCWGDRDVADCIAGVRELVARDRIDPTRVAIRGGSAGGYLTLRALTTSNVFKAGASHYGIADLKVLDEETHKFESRYIAHLVPKSHMERKSPVYDIVKLQCPVVFFQGQDDKVVPPSQTEMMFKELAGNDIATAMFLFEGEGHGFRMAKNMRIALEAEYLFFCRAFDIPLDDADWSIFSNAQTANFVIP